MDINNTAQVDLLVCNYNTQSKLERLVRTLWGSTPQGTERTWRLIVADNGSQDGSVDWIKKNYFYIDDIILQDNVGYAKAINMMAARSNSPILAALNADVWFTNNDVNKIATVFEHNPSIGIQGPKQRDERGRITHGGIIDLCGKPKHRGWMEHDPNDNFYRQIDDVDTVSGSAYFVRRSVWDELTQCPIYQEIDPGSQGAFLQTPHFYEETWCSVHAVAHGYRVIYNGSVSMGHSWHASSPVGGDADQQFPISRDIFIKATRHHKIPTEFD